MPGSGRISPNPVAFGAAGGETVAEGMAELVRRHLGVPGFGGAPDEHLADPGVPEARAVPGPEPPQSESASS